METTTGYLERTEGTWARWLTPAVVLLPLLLGVSGCEPVHGAETSNGETGKAATAEAGADWATVQEYLDWHRALLERARNDAMGEEADGEAEASEEEPLERIPIQPAVAAARAIVDQDGAHEKTIQAAEFLMELARYERFAGLTPANEEHMYAGAKALLAHAPEYWGWPRLLRGLDASRRFTVDGKSSRPKVDELLEDLASSDENPSLRAAARYYVAAGIMRSVNGIRVSAEDRQVRRNLALEAATGLSSGVEEERFRGSFPGAESTQTYADVEAALIRRIRHSTVGGTLPDVTSVRLDGVEESLADYRGRVVLLDFWATWCPPCIAALPKLRELVAETPEDRFVLLSISVDTELETVTEFQKERPMPWANWFDGSPRESEVVRALDVRGFPTYILVNEDGEILATTNFLNLEFMALLREAVGAE